MNKIAISNLAWDVEESEAVYGILRERGVEGIEIAPGKVFGALPSVAHQEADSYRRAMAQRGFSTVAFQAFLFGHPELVLFGDDLARARLRRYIQEIIVLARRVGARILVYGAPKSRNRGELSYHEAFEVARAFFKKIGDFAAEHNVMFCIEPNPTAYDCNFVTTSDEGAALVRAVDSRGFGLHLDTAGMHLSGEDFERAFTKHKDLIRHVHVSEPRLAGFREPCIDHERVAALLRCIGYKGWRSVEMLRNPNSLEGIVTVLNLMKRTYARL